MNGSSSNKHGTHRMILPRNNNMTAIFVVIFNPDIGYDRIYAQIGAAGKNHIGPQFNNKSMVELTCPDFGSFK